MIRSPVYNWNNVEPWEISASGKVTRVVRHRAKLNPRQKRFIVEYLKDGNGTRAAVRAGYAPSSAAVQACRLLQNDRVLNNVRACQKLVLVQRGNEALFDKTLLELQAICSFDPAPLFDRKGKLLPLHKLPRDAYRAIASFEIEHSVKGGRKVRTERVKFVDRVAALDTLAKCLGLILPPQ